MAELEQKKYEELTGEEKKKIYDSMSDAERAELEAILLAWTRPTLRTLLYLLLIEKNFGKRRFNYYISHSSTPDSYKQLWTIWLEMQPVAFERFKKLWGKLLGKRKIKTLGL